ncbi:MAG: phage scaffolding protein [Angelakisella sp.]
MKREFITSLLPDIGKDLVDKILDENSKDIEATKGKFSDYDDLKTQLAEAGKTIEGFKAMDIDGIKKAADDWKTKAEQAEKDAAAKIAEMEFNTLLDGTITSAKGRNAKAIKALLDMDTLKASKNQTEDVQKALEALKGENGYLFEDSQTPPPYAAGTGGKPMNGEITHDAFAKMGYRERVELKQKNPEIYEKMKE